MKILLLGEYSNLHNSLKAGLVHLGHEVTLISSGDGFKQFESDVLLKNLSFLKKHTALKKIFAFVFRYPFRFYTQSIQFQKILPSLKNYDYVQLINEHSIGGVPWIEKIQLSKLSKQNKKMVLLCCGDDFNSINFFNSSNEIKYSILTPLHLNSKLEEKYAYSLKYLTKPFYSLSRHISKLTLGIIASDIDYHLALKNNPKYIGLIPNPVILNKIKPHKKQHSTIRILLGVNTASYIKKGLNYFEDALEIIRVKYPEVAIKKTENLGFEAYIKELNQTDILLDQVFSYDQGYNALEAMALGKVVFTGAEQEFLDYYNLKEDEVAINALPDVDYLVEKISMLIEQPKKIEEIGANAKVFVTNHHEASKVAKTYLSTWKKTTEQQL